MTGNDSQDKVGALTTSAPRKSSSSGTASVSARESTPPTRARGDARIEKDPEYWADQTMLKLLDAVAT